MRRVSLLIAFSILMSVALLSSCGGGGGGNNAGTTVSAPTNLFAWYMYSGSSTTAQIGGATVSGASSYRLYSSMNGTTYSQVTNFVNPLSIWNNFFSWNVVVPQNTWFRITALTNGIESTPSQPVYLDHTNRNSMPPVSMTSPLQGETGVSLTPTFAWTAVPGAAGYIIGVNPNSGADTVCLVKISGTAWIYGSNTNVTVNYLGSSAPLQRNTDYSYFIAAVDTNGTMLAGSKILLFTTIP